MRSLLGIPSSSGNTLALTPLECAVEHPMKDANPEGASRSKDLSANVNALECAVTENRALTPLECADTKTPRRNPFRMRSYKKRWGGGPASSLATRLPRASRGHSPLLL